MEILMLYKKDIFREYYLGREIIRNLFSWAWPKKKNGKNDEKR